MSTKEKWNPPQVIYLTRHEENTAEEWLEAAEDPAHLDIPREPVTIGVYKLVGQHTAQMTLKVGNKK